MAVQPTITFPTTSAGFSTNLQNQTLGGTAHPSTVQILVNGSPDGVIYTSGDATWLFSGDLISGENTFNVSAKDVFNSVSSADVITVTLTSEDNLNLLIGPPTGIILERSKDSVTISVIENPESEVIGYNFYGAENAGGGSDGFTLLNRTLIQESSFFKENIVVLSESIETSGNVRTIFKVEEVQRSDYFSYTHNRVNQPLGQKPLTEPNHYIVTAIGFDPNTQQQVESPFSGELGTTPLILDTSIRDLSIRKTVDIQQSYIDQILSINRDVDVKPGTLTRDIHINPPSDEFERLYTVIDFLHRSQSFLTLIEFDDADGDEISDPVLESNAKIRLKEALLLPDERADDVQRLIDDAFDKLAGNVNVVRKSNTSSIGQALFFTRATPTQEVSINAGAIVETLSDDNTRAVQFQVLTDFNLPVSDLSNFFNPQTQRYEVLLDIEAIQPGQSGDVDSGKIRVISSGINPIFGVTNPNPTDFGQDEESNYNLAQRAVLAFVSVDAGTEGGYLATTLGTPNVTRAKIISAGEDLMMRDIDPLRLVHTFGMVDIYVYGSKQTTVSEDFGFIYKTRNNDQAIIQSASLFHFKIENSEINIEKPIYEVLKVRNVTKAEDYDLTGFVIIGDGEVIDLNESLPTNTLIGLDPTDVIQVSYRYRDSEPYIFLSQPVESIVSVVGELSGTLSSSNYTLQKLEDPLQFGNSTSSSDRMQIKFFNGVPLGSTVSVTDEEILLFAQNEVELERFAIDPDSIFVTDSQNVVTYLRDIDYEIITGNSNTKTKIKRTQTSSIASGSTLKVDYMAGENFTVRYNVNALLADVQQRVDKMKHLTADVVLKGAIRNLIDIEMTVLLEQNSDQTSIDRKIRTAISKVLSSKQIGESIYQSDIVHAIEGISGVSHVEIPFLKMVKANGSYVVHEPYNGQFQIHQTGIVTSYKSIGKLNWETTAMGGGDGNLFVGVYENDILLSMQNNSDAVSVAAGRSYIDNDGFIYVSPSQGDISNATVKTTYIVQDAVGSRDISFSDIEYGGIGTLNITYDFIRKFRGF